MISYTANFIYIVHQSIRNNTLTKDNIIEITRLYYGKAYDKRTGEFDYLTDDEVVQIIQENIDGGRTSEYDEVEEFVINNKSILTHICEKMVEFGFCS